MDRKKASTSVEFLFYSLHFLYSSRAISDHDHVFSLVKLYLNIIGKSKVSRFLFEMTLNMITSNPKNMRPYENHD
jgi:hypothetical protein